MDGPETILSNNGTTLEEAAEAAKPIFISDREPITEAPTAPVSQ